MKIKALPSAGNADDTSGIRYLSPAFGAQTHRLLLRVKYAKTLPAFWYEIIQKAENNNPVTKKCTHHIVNFENDFLSVN